MKNKKPNGCYSGLVHVWDLPDSVYVDFEVEYRKKMLETLKKLSPKKNWYTITKLLFPNKKPREAFNLIVSFVRRDTKISLKIVKKISRILVKRGNHKFSLRNMEKHISCLASNGPSNKIINPKMPFNFNNSDGTRIVAAIFCDGGVTKKLNPFYVNFDSNLRLLVKSSFVKTFGKIQGKIEGKRNQLTFPKIIGEILVHGLGLPYGRKIYFNLSLPEFIFDTDKCSQISVIKQAFDDDGSVSNKSIKFTSAGISEPPLLLKDIKKLLEIFKIKTTNISSAEEYYVKSGKKHKWYCFHISGRTNLIKFYRIINFNSKKKSEKLKTEINSYKQWQVGHGEALNNTLFNIKRLELENKSITTKNLMKKMNRSYSQVSLCIRQLAETGFLKMVKDSCSTINGPTFREFKLTNKGRERIKFANIFEYG